MKPQNKAPAASGFGIHDVIYIIFKHKWKILLLSLIGFAVAGVMGYRIIREPSYESAAKLMVRYVVERSTVDPEAGERMMSGGMQAETEILMSRDTAMEVAEALGPEKFLPKAKTPPTASEVAGMIQGGLKVEVPKGATRNSTSNLLFLSYRSNDPALATQVLGELIQVYFRKHLELHRSTEAFGQVSKQADEARSKLRQTEEEINQLKNKSGILTIEATMAEFEARKQAILERQMMAEAQLAEQRAKVATLKKSKAPASQVDAAPDAQNLSDAPRATVAPEPAVAGVEAKRLRALALAEYDDLRQRLAMLQQRRNERLVGRTPSDPMIASLDRQIAQVQQRELDLVEENPDFAGQAQAVANGGPLIAPVLSLDDEVAIESALEARLQAVITQAKGLESEVAGISSLGFQLQELERRRQMEEEKYRYFQIGLEKARLDETLDASKIPNISVVQNPSPPVKSIDQDALKLILGIAFSGLAAGLALAFLIEMVIDRRVSRPVEIQSRLQLPLMLSIPYVRSKDGIAKLLGSHAASDASATDGQMILASNSNTSIDQADRAGEHFIAPYVAAMHDRIIFNFQVNNINHKPKLVALTGLSQGAGTSTLAAGLAKAFAENRSQKVLLVDLNAEPNASENHPAESLYKALQMSRSEQFRQAPRSLYFAGASTRRDSKNPYALAPTALQDIMPHLVASDFDYIVFDMPPIGPTSPTLTMAGFMDKVLLVLDGDNTTREHLSWGYTELEKAKADVSCIFNKARSHAPRWVQGTV